MDLPRIRRTLDEQAGVISRHQVLLAGGSPADIARLVRRREWVRLLPGVLLDHTGEPTWLQRAWAGVVFHSPAALGGRSALRAALGPGWRHHRDDDPIEIAVPQRRHVDPQPGYAISRRSDFAGRVQWNASPPRIRIEHAGLDVAAAAESEFELIAVLADLCQTRRTTAPRLLGALAERGKVRHRAWLSGILGDVAAGSCSVLEQGYLDRVERAHGLPVGRRQTPVAVGGRGCRRDVEYDAIVVELDGRLFHDSAGARDVDLDRDLVTAVEGKDAVRLGWGQVFDRPCWTARQVALLLHRRGWLGVPLPCHPGCDVASTGVGDAPGAPYAPVDRPGRWVV